MMRRVQDFVIACTVVAGIFSVQACAQQFWWSGPGGQFQAGHLHADLGERTVTLDGGARLKIVQGAVR